MTLAVLTPELATEIATETSEILGRCVSITDREGTIIGSGDPKRIGTLHPISIRIVATGETSNRTREEIREPGVRPGMTMPIRIEGVIVGTVGIAGPPNVVRRLGRLVQRQTEILLRESLSQRTRVLREAAIAQLVNDIVLYDEHLLDPSVLTLRAEELGYDLSGARAAVALEPIDGGTRRLLRAQTVRDAFPGKQDIVGRLPNERYLVLLQATQPAPHGNTPWQELHNRCQAAAAALRQHHGVHARLGLGAVGWDIPALARSCDDATTALRISRQQKHTNNVVDITRLRMQQALESLPTPARSRFIDSQLAELQSSADYPVLQSTVIAWCESGFNLVRAAATLNIHRNTIIYRLDKIQRLTGQDLRTPQEAFPIYLATLISKQFNTTPGDKATRHRPNRRSHESS